MSTAQEHEIVPAIREWLAATADLEIATGLSRDEARRRARELLAAIEAGSVAPDQVEADDDLKDVLWAIVEELDEKPLGHSTFEECDRVYQFVTALSVESDPFDERDEVLHRVARIGWGSAPGGLAPVLKARAGIWEHGDEQRHRALCETADHLLNQIDAVKGKHTLDVAEIQEICARLVKLANIRPSLIATAASTLAVFLMRRERLIGWLDDCEYLRAVALLAAGMAARLLGGWVSAESRYEQAASAFHRTAATVDLDRIVVERLALQVVRMNYLTVTESAPSLMQALVVSRERIKAQLILTHALLSLDRPEDARVVLEAVRQDPAIEKEPTLSIWLLTMLGNALSDTGREAEAAASFNAAGTVLASFPNAMLMGDLVSSIGEYVGKLGNLNEAVSLYGTARKVSGQLGQAYRVGYLSVLRAQLLMMLGKDEEAETELLAVLPLIEKFELRSEAAVAAALLRKSMLKRRPDVEAIKKLRDQLRKGLH